MIATRLATIADIEAMHDEPGRVALIEGELYRMAPAGGRHGRLGVRLTVALHLFVEAHESGVVYGADTGFVLQREPDTLLAPDVTFIRKDRVPVGDDEIGFPEVVPDLVVEILSPSNTSTMMTKKVNAYLAAGVSLIWVVNPVHSVITVHEQDGHRREIGMDGILDGGHILPGLSLPVADLFQP
jgi:Uma2 family endonuclease